MKDVKRFWKRLDESAAIHGEGAAMAGLLGCGVLTERVEC